MHDVFLDEAGTSGAPHEPISVVAGVVVPNEKRDAIADTIRAVIDETVPRQFRENFVFHALDLMHREEFRKSWPLRGLTGRLALLHSMMRIPAAHQLPVVWAAARNGCPVEGEIKHVSKAEFVHIVTFLHCIGTYDHYLCDKDETGIVIVEDLPELRTRLNNAFHVMRGKPFSVNGVYSDPDRCTNADQGVPPSASLEFKISRISDAPYFLPKRAIPAMQLADACAFGIRSFLSGAAHSEDYGRLILGNHDERPDWRKSTGIAFGGIVEWHRTSEPQANQVPLPL